MENLSGLRKGSTANEKEKQFEAAYQEEKLPMVDDLAIIIPKPHINDIP